jgi:hypothetical protein
MTEGFPAYAGLARELDDVRSREVARSAGELQGAADQTTHADALEARLNGQRGMLQRVAGELGFREPRFSAVEPAESLDPARALARIAERIDTADLEARLAAERGEGTTTVRGVRRRRPPVRAAVVYGVAAVLAFCFQAPGWHRLFLGPEGGPKEPPSVFVPLFVVPAVLFAISWVLVRLTAPARRPGAKGAYETTRLGLLVVFGTGPLGLLAFAVYWGISQT